MADGNLQCSFISSLTLVNIEEEALFRKRGEEKKGESTGQESLLCALHFPLPSLWTKPLERRPHEVRLEGCTHVNFPVT